MKTWKDIKDETLQLMFQYSQYGNLLTNDPHNKDFELAMPAAANYAMRDLASVRPIVRTERVSFTVPNNLIDTTTISKDKDDVYVQAKDAKAFYFEVNDVATIQLGIVTDTGWVNVFQTIEHTGSGVYKAYKGTIAKRGIVRITFTGSTSYEVRNIALYDAPYTEESVPDNKGYISIDLRKLDGYMRIADMRPVTIDGRDISAYTKYVNRSSLIIEAHTSGYVDVSYYKYPEPIKADTPDDYIPELDVEALDAVPLYMASRLFAIGDADRPMAVMYQNMYDARKQELATYSDPCGTDQLTSVTGWI